MDHNTDTGTRHWPLHGFWRVWFWISAGIAAVIGAAGLGLVVLAFVVTVVPTAVLLVTALPLLAVGAVIGWQLSSTVLDVTLAADGTLTMRRLGRVLRTQAAHVRVVRPSALVSSYTPTVIETTDGSVTLIHPRPEVDELVAAIRRTNPTVKVWLRT